jgi:hypothetical protein
MRNAVALLCPRYLPSEKRNLRRLGRRIEPITQEVVAARQKAIVEVVVVKRIVVEEKGSQDPVKGVAIVNAVESQADRRAEEMLAAVHSAEMAEIGGDRIDQVVDTVGGIASPSLMVLSAKRNPSRFRMRCRKEKSHYDPLVT